MLAFTQILLKSQVNYDYFIQNLLRIFVLARIKTSRSVYLTVVEVFN